MLPIPMLLHKDFFIVRISRSNTIMPLFLSTNFHPPRQRFRINAVLEDGISFRSLSNTITKQRQLQWHYEHKQTHEHLNNSNPNTVGTDKKSHTNASNTKQDPLFPRTGTQARLSCICFQIMTATRTNNRINQTLTTSWVTQYQRMKRRISQMPSRSDAISRTRCQNHDRQYSVLIKRRFSRKFVNWKAIPFPKYEFKCKCKCKYKYNYKDKYNYNYKQNTTTNAQYDKRIPQTQTYKIRKKRLFIKRTISMEKQQSTKKERKPKRKQQRQIQIHIQTEYNYERTIRQTNSTNSNIQNTKEKTLY